MMVVGVGEYGIGFKLLEGFMLLMVLGFLVDQEGGMEENRLFLYLLVGVINLFIFDSVDRLVDGRFMFMEFGINGGIGNY